MHNTNDPNKKQLYLIALLYVSTRKQTDSTKSIAASVRGNIHGWGLSVHIKHEERQQLVVETYAVYYSKREVLFLIWDPSYEPSYKKINSDCPLFLAALAYNGIDTD